MTDVVEAAGGGVGQGGMDAQLTTRTPIKTIEFKTIFIDKGRSLFFQFLGHLDSIADRVSSP